MKVVVNSKYGHLTPFIEGVLNRSYTADKTYRNFRNIVEDTTECGTHMVVKIFKKPTEVNRVVYTFLRSTKAKRSYEYSVRLIREGIDVPEPIAYIEKSKGLFFHTGCYISLFTDYRPISEFKDLDTSEERQFKRLERFIEEFAVYAADFHSKGFVHNDFNIDNILYKESDGHFKFQLIDVNRMKFNNTNLGRCAKDLSNVHFSQNMMIGIVERYCRQRALDVEDFSRKVAHSLNKSKGVSKVKNKVLTALGIKKEKHSQCNVSA